MDWGTQLHCQADAVTVFFLLLPLQNQIMMMINDVYAKISDRKVIPVSRSLGQSTAKIKIISLITQ